MRKKYTKKTKSIWCTLKLQYFTFNYTYQTSPLLWFNNNNDNNNRWMKQKTYNFLLCAFESNINIIISLQICSCPSFVLCLLEVVSRPRPDKYSYFIGSPKRTKKNHNRKDKERVQARDVRTGLFLWNPVRNSFLNRAAWKPSFLHTARVREMPIWHAYGEEWPPSILFWLIFSLGFKNPDSVN